MALALLLKGALLSRNGQMEPVEIVFEKISKCLFQFFFQKCWQFEKIHIFWKMSWNRTFSFWRKFTSERACFLKAALLANGQIDIPAILPLPPAYNYCYYLGSLVQWKWLIVNSASLLCLIMACARLLNAAILRASGQPRLFGMLSSLELSVFNGTDEDRASEASEFRVGGVSYAALIAREVEKVSP